MGKVLSRFINGCPGTVSRIKDDVIISMKNVGAAAIKPGDPVFLKNSVTPAGVQGFISGTTTENDFVGFAVRVADKTPETADSSLNQWNAGDLVDILVRGSLVVSFGTSGAKTGQQVYVRKSDAVLVSAAGTEGSTIPVPDTFVRTPRDSASTCEIVVTKRHLQ